MPISQIRELRHREDPRRGGGKAQHEDPIQAFSVFTPQALFSPSSQPTSVSTQCLCPMPVLGPDQSPFLPSAQDQPMQDYPETPSLFPPSFWCELEEGGAETTELLELGPLP